MLKINRFFLKFYGYHGNAIMRDENVSYVCDRSINFIYLFDLVAVKMD